MKPLQSNILGLQENTGECTILQTFSIAAQLKKNHDAPHFRTSRHKENRK